MTLLVSRFDESIVLYSEYGVRNFMIRNISDIQWF